MRSILKQRKILTEQGIATENLQQTNTEINFSILPHFS